MMIIIEACIYKCGPDQPQILDDKDFISKHEI